MICPPTLLATYYSSRLEIWVHFCVTSKILLLPGLVRQAVMQISQHSLDKNCIALESVCITIFKHTKISQGTAHTTTTFIRECSEVQTKINQIVNEQFFFLFFILLLLYILYIASCLLCSLTHSFMPRRRGEKKIIF